MHSKTVQGVTCGVWLRDCQSDRSSIVESSVRCDIPRTIVTPNAIGHLGVQDIILWNNCPRMRNMGFGASPCPNEIGSYSFMFTSTKVQVRVHGNDVGWLPRASLRAWSGHGDSRVALIPGPKPRKSTQQPWPMNPLGGSPPTFRACGRGCGTAGQRDVTLDRLPLRSHELNRASVDLGGGV